MKVTVTLDEGEWGQIIDSLTYRAELYEETERYYESGYAGCEIAEVRDGYEARNMALLYRCLLRKVEKSLAGMK